MDYMRISIAGDNRVGLRFEQFPDALRADLLREISALTAELLGRVRAATPDRTGKLLAQETMRVFSDKDKISGKVDIASSNPQDFRKAAALEYGSTGKPVAVRSHAMALDHFWSTRLASPITVLTKAYSRTPNIAETAFERGPLAQMQPEINARLEAIVADQVKAANA